MPLAYEPGAGKQASKVAFEKAEGRDGANSPLELTERQRYLNWLYSWYCAAQYDNRRVDFDGKEYKDPINREAIVTGTFIPPGFYDVGQQYPIKFRRPVAAYHLARVIVDRFTELLFGENRSPRVRVLGDAKTDDYVQAIIEVTDLWGRMLQARKLGGAMGTVAIGFVFIDGEPRVEVHDPRWCFPEFEDRDRCILSHIEKRWIYGKEERVSDGKGSWKWDTVYYWYRRVVTKEYDAVFKPVRYVKGQEPLWIVDEDLSVEHGLGFCPVLWIQNHEVPGQIDGESDCHGVYDQIEQMDLLQSMAFRGILMNCDPTAVIKEDEEMSEIAKGSDNTIKLTKGGDFAYVEISATGPKAAQEAAQTLKEQILEVTQTFLPPADGGAVQQTATQIERTASSMLAKASLLRRQYGKAALDLIKMILRAAQRMMHGVKTPDGMRARRVLRLPPKVEETPDGKVTVTNRELGGGGHLRLSWPRYFEYSLDEIEKATTSAGTAKEKGLIDDRHASEFVADMYHVKNVQGMLDQMKKEKEEAAAAEQQQMQAQMGGGFE